MPAERLILQQEPPEWRRIGYFVLLAIALHLLALLYPLRNAFERLASTLPEVIELRLVQPASAAPEALPPAPGPALAKPLNRSTERPLPKQHPVPVLSAAPTAASTAVHGAGDESALVAAPVAPSPPPPAVTVARFDAAYLQNPRPAYPPLSRRLGEEGKVLLRVRVSTEGQAAAVDLEKSSNFERLDDAARQVVAHWRFVPARRGDEAIEATVIVPIVFRLDG